jgi:hypothetical protein
MKISSPGAHRVGNVIASGLVRPRGVSRTWRSAKQAAVRQYGAGPAADRVAVQAMKRFFKWVAKHPRRRARTAQPAEPAILSSALRPR